MANCFAQVLIPPRMVLLYKRLLRAEVDELSRGLHHHVPWQTIIEIRAINDRAIQNSQKLANWKPPRMPSLATFLSIHAPPDFHCTILEKWYKELRGEHYVQNRYSIQDPGECAEPLVMRQCM